MLELTPFRTQPARAEASEEALPETLTEQPAPSEREFWLLKFILLDDEHIDWVARHLDLAWIQHPTVRRIVSLRLVAHAAHSWHGVPSLLSECGDDVVAAALVTEAVAAEQSKDNLARKISDTILRLRNDHLDRQLVTLTRRLSQPDMSEAGHIEIEREKGQLRQAKLQSLQPRVASPELAPEHPSGDSPEDF